MTLLYVTVTGNLGPAAAGAKGYWVPTGWLTAAADMRVIPPAPAPPFTIGADGSFTSGPLLAQDSPGIQPQGEAWTLSISGIDDVAPFSQSYAILHANGATQDLSTLPVAVPDQQFTTYLLAANNLSDVDSASAALANLGGASTTALAAETTRAEAAEATLAAGVTANSAAIAAETTRAEGAETTLAGGVSANAAAITAETARAEAAEALALQKAANLSDLANAATARTNLGLGTAATQAATAFLATPSGSPSAGQVPAATGTGQASAWANAALMGGYLCIPAAAGPPSGTPSIPAGFVALAFDTVTSQVWAFSGAWKAVTVS